LNVGPWKIEEDMSGGNPTLSVFNTVKRYGYRFHTDGTMELYTEKEGL